MVDVLKFNYELYERDPNRNLDNPEVTQLHSYHFASETDNLDVWRQHRLMEPVLSRMAYTKQNSWLTVGDGAYGLEAIRMRRKGFINVLPTDIDGKLLEVSKRNGHIKDYKVENGEKLSFPDESFDFVLCKDSYHHMPRPMIALYEMLRVAKKGVVLIEPQDPWIDDPITPGPWIAGYESVGNYVYTVSRRELVKAAQALDIKVYGFKNIYDHVIPEIEKVSIDPNNPTFIEYMRNIIEGQKLVQDGKVKGNMLFAILFKERPTDSEVQMFFRDAEGWNLTEFPGNPHRKDYIKSLA
jgi:ubiquinone/menaquinone biosynthesis C-methylase UbiE